MYALTLTSLIFDELISMGGCVESLIYILSYLHTKHLVKTGANPTIATFTYILFLKKRGCLGWGANPGPFDFIYCLIYNHFTAEPQRLPTFTYIQLCR
jgi:hypothetical protein